MKTSEPSLPLSDQHTPTLFISQHSPHYSYPRPSLTFVPLKDYLFIFLCIYHHRVHSSLHMAQFCNYSMYKIIFPFVASFFFPAIAMMKTPVYPFYDIMPAVSPSVTGLACGFCGKGLAPFSPPQLGGWSRSFRSVSPWERLGRCDVDSSVGAVGSSF